MNPETCSLFEEEEVTSQEEDSPPFEWWPPDFLLGSEEEEEEDDEPESEMIAAMKADVRAALEDASDERDVDAIISQRLNESYRIIDNQQLQIHRLREEMDKVFVAEQRAQKERLRRERSRRVLLLWGTAITAVTVSLVFHQEISQVGWNLFSGAAAIFGLPPKGIVGFLTCGALVWLFTKVARAVWNAALEDLMEEDEDDLFDR